MQPLVLRSLVKFCRDYWTVGMLISWPTSWFLSQWRTEFQKIFLMYNVAFKEAQNSLQSCKICSTVTSQKFISNSSALGHPSCSVWSLAWNIQVSLKINIEHFSYFLPPNPKPYATCYYVLPWSLSTIFYIFSNYYICLCL